VLSLFFFVSPFLEVLSQTAQAFLPQFYAGRRAEDGKQKDPARATALEEGGALLALRLLGLGAAVSVVVVAAVVAVPAAL